MKCDCSFNEGFAAAAACIGGSSCSQKLQRGFPGLFLLSGASPAAAATCFAVKVLIRLGSFCSAGMTVFPLYASFFVLQ